jgi:molecular chaperone GrpE
MESEEKNIQEEAFTGTPHEYEVTELSSKLEESESKYLMLYADFENYKKRAAKEKEEIRNSVKASMLSSVLDLDSDISIAIKSIKDESAREGVELIAAKVEKFLKSQGIEAIQTEEYDSDLHEVVTVLPVGEKKIVDVISKGYSIDGKPFRYPKIILGE